MLRLPERRRYFNVDELQKVAAQSLNRFETEIKNIPKLVVDGFYRAP